MLKKDILHSQRPFYDRVESNRIDGMKKSHASPLVGMKHVDNVMVLLDDGLRL